ncbi:sensor histidine kinase [Rickettsiella endosymbiont of Dermanyssus gallinae]|uniref:sensor histidine kinase n=1 Tax=Rickettsiella endosymbiont of Dermanyssus gallinae TaxID=2856608 RepID=UPI001C5336B3|nr:ATP-binding protein [Rickettsiella endosymbiont of Dermanyssus gallinae]
MRNYTENNNKSELKDSFSNILIDLKRQMELIIEINKPLANKKKLILTLNYDQAIYPYLIGDPDRVQRIALELITNAIKFTEQGKVTLIVRLIRSNYQESIIEIAVSDTGIGISKDQRKKMFHRFNRLTSSCKGVYKGGYFGLSIVKQFVDDLQGEIFVKSKEGEGTILGCFIPFQHSLTMNYSSGTHKPISLLRRSIWRKHDMEVTN